MSKRIIRLWIIVVLLLPACGRPQNQEPESTDRHIVAHPQYDRGDRIDCLGWQERSELTLEINDPNTGKGVDYSATRLAVQNAEGEMVTSFELGSDWNLLPGHVIIVTDGESTISHTVRDIAVTSVDIESNVVTGTAQPGTEVMVWIEAPYPHELRVVADASGEFQADFSQVTDIIPATFGAIAQNDVPPAGSSHTRINFTFGELHLESSINHDVVGFNNFTPFNEVAFQIFESRNGSLIFEDTKETNEIGYATFDNEDRVVDLQPGTYILALDRASQRHVESVIKMLRIDTVEMGTGEVSGITGGGTTVYVNIYDHQSEAEFAKNVKAAEDGSWMMRFDIVLTHDMLIAAHIDDGYGNEIAFQWIWE